jgi:PAS domain S-box-containing protein
MPSADHQRAAGRSFPTARSVAVAAAGLVTLGGLASAAGWLTNFPRLSDWKGDGITIKFNTAVALFSAGLSLAVHLFFPRWKAAVRIFAGVTAAIAGLTLVENVTGIDLRFDNLFVTEPHGALATSAPGRMGLPASSSLLMIATALVLLTAQGVRRWASPIATATILIASLSLTGYLFGADQLYSIPKYTGIALQTAWMIAILAIGIIAANPHHGLASVLQRDDAGGEMFRRLLMPMIVIALVLGWLRVAGQQAGYYDSSFGTAARTVAEIALLILLLGWAANGMSRADRQIRLVSRMPEENPNPVMRLTPEGEVIYANSASRMLVEYLNENATSPVARDLKTAVADSFASGNPCDIEIDFMGRTYAVLVSPVTEERQVNFYGTDITERKAAERIVLRQADEQAVLYRLTDQVHRANDIHNVYEAALTAILDSLGCDRASILTFNDAGVMSFVGSRGLSEDYRRAVEGHTPWKPGERDATPLLIPDIRKAEISEDLRRTIIGEGIAALGFVPLYSGDGELLGKFMVYFDEPHEWSDGQMELAQTVSRQIAFGVERKTTEQALRENDERLRLATQTGTVGIWDWNIASNRITWTDSLFAMHGIERDDFDGTVDGLVKLVHPDDADKVRSAIYSALAGERSYEIEFRVLKPDGTMGWLFMNAIVVGEGDNRRMLGATVEVTQRKEAELASARLAAIVESSFDAVIAKDLNGIIMSWNSGAERLFGYSADEIVGLPVTTLMPPDRVAEETEILRKIRNGEAVDHFETIRVRKDGERRDISLTISPVRDGTGAIVGASKIARDITDRRRIDAAIRERETLQSIVQAQEAERSRIARDLHDHLGQQLTGLRLKLASLVSLMSKEPGAVRQIEEASEQAERIDADMSLLAWELRPVSLDLHGLAETLASFVREWGQSHGINAEFQASSTSDRLPMDIETNVYRIAQEALNNVLKHAAATEVSVTLNHTRHEAVLVVEDNGKGFDPEATTSGASGGLGLTGMRERAALLGGRLEVESSPDSGTTIYARIPVSETSRQTVAAP